MVFPIILSCFFFGSTRRKCLGNSPLGRQYLMSVSVISESWPLAMLVEETGMTLLECRLDYIQ